MSGHGGARRFTRPKVDGHIDVAPWADYLHHFDVWALSRFQSADARARMHAEYLRIDEKRRSDRAV